MVYKSWIRLVTRNVRKSCLMLQAKKPNPKLWSGSFCLLRAYDIEKMSSDYLVHQILFYKNIKRLFLSMVAFGMDIRGVNILDSHLLM